MLSATTEYALRALVHLAQQPPATPLLGRGLADRARIPANYLAKILLTLRNAGLVETARGQGGGYQLARRPDQIRLLEVVELFERVQERTGCLLGEEHDCCDEDACSAHQRWKEVRQAYIRFLTTNTILDIGPSGAGGASRSGAGRRTSRVK